MKLITTFMISLLLLTLASCGGSKGKSSDTYTYATVEEMRADLDRQSVQCASQSDCPGYVAKLAMWERQGSSYTIGTCSGSLYNNKYIITNSHCIPQSLKAGSSCSDQLKVLFPTTSQFYNEEANCLRVIQVHREDGPDIAVFELDRVVHRTSIEVEKNAFVEEADVYAHTVNPMTRTLGYVYKKSCKLSVDNALTFHTNSYAPEAVIHGYACSVIGGNSGSALMRNGKMIGAVFARLTEEAAPKFTQAGINYAVTQPTGFAQNIGCIRDITTNSGHTCFYQSPNATAINAFIERAKLSQGFAGTDEASIEYKLIDGLKLQLTKVNIASFNKSLSSFRTNWTSYFKANASAQARSNFIVK